MKSGLSKVCSKTTGTVSINKEKINDEQLKEYSIIINIVYGHYSLG